MKLPSIVYTAVVLLVTGCNKAPKNSLPDPVNIGATVTLAASGARQNPFTGKETEFQINADFTISGVILFRNASIDKQGSVVMVTVAVKNGANEPLILQRPDFSLITESGKVYSAGLRAGGPWIEETRDLGPDMAGTIMVAFKIPYDGLKETTCFAVGGTKLVRITDVNMPEPNGWLVCDKASLVKSTYSEFFQ